MGIVPGASSFQAFDPFGAVAAAESASPALGACACRHVLHLLAVLIARFRTALVPLWLLFGGLCEDLATFLCKTVYSKRVMKGYFSGFRR
jgi:hypothetical protein